jgi:general secretion pathway protein C
LSFNEIIERWRIPDTEALAVRASAILPFWVSLVLVIALGYYAARLVWLLVSVPAPVAWSPPPPASTPAAAAPAAGDSVAAAIAGVHLFGQAEATAGTAEIDVVNAPETQLNLQLHGLVAAADERFAHAIIADDSGIEKVYFVKDSLPGGATVHAIQADRVLLARGGTVEVLLLPRESHASAAAPPQGALQQLATRIPPPNMQETVSQNATSFNDIMRPQPFMPNGELKGYRIYPGRNREQFTALGLQPGDLVTEINGMTLNNPAQAMELFRSLADTTQVTVTLEREGQPQTLTLDTTQVADAGGATH